LSPRFRAFRGRLRQWPILSGSADPLTEQLLLAREIEEQRQPQTVAV